MMEILKNRDTKYKKVGNKHYLEFYVDNRMIGLIDYSDHSTHYVEDARENFMTGIMTEETIQRYNLGKIPE